VTLSESSVADIWQLSPGIFGRWSDCAPVGDVVPFFDAGTYHLFCLTPPPDSLHFPERLRTTWRHFRSTDLMHWERLPDALAPGAESKPDGGGIWTGSVLRTETGYHIFYTGHAPGAAIPQSICRATSTDCVTWTKDPSNPVSVPELENFAAQDWRDPFVFWHEDERCYWMLLSTRSTSGSAPARGAVALRTSPDLQSWSKTTVLYETVFTHCPECPEIFRLGDEWVMAYSRFTDRRGTVYRFADNPRGPWHAFSHDRLDGPNWYASKSLADDAGRRIAFGWIPDRNPEPTPKTGDWLWGGDLGVPRELLLESGKLGIRIPAKVAECKQSELAYGARYLAGDWHSETDGSYSVDAPGHFGYCTLHPEELVDDYIFSLDMSWSVDTTIVGVALATMEKLDRGVAILCYPKENRITAVDLGSPPLPSDGPGDAQQSTAGYAPVAEGRLARPQGARVPWQVVVRKGIVEAFVGGAACLSYRLSSAKPGQVALLTQDGSASFLNVRWQTIATAATAV
jgi:beta-fructofuranosidase